MAWGDFHYLLIDMPPGASEIQMGLARMLPRTEVLIVTTPALAAQKAAARAADMARKGYLRVDGVIENMSASMAADGSLSAVFGTGGGQPLADEIGVSLLGSIPLDPAVAAGGETGEPVTVAARHTPAAQALHHPGRTHRHRGHPARRDGHLYCPTVLQGSRPAPHYPVADGATHPTDPTEDPTNRSLSLMSTTQIQTAPVITITANAGAKIAELIAREGDENLALRVAYGPADAPGSPTRCTSTPKSIPKTTWLCSARSGCWSTRPAPSTSPAQPSTTRTASRPTASTSTTPTPSDPAAAGSRSRSAFGCQKSITSYDQVVFMDQSVQYVTADDQLEPGWFALGMRGPSVRWHQPQGPAGRRPSWPRRGRARYPRPQRRAGLNHCPSGRFFANAAWTVFATIAHNLLRWTDALGFGTTGPVVTKTLRRRLLTLPGRMTRTARIPTLHLPTRWPWAGDFVAALGCRIRALTLTRS